ncbi:MAG: hypothetical protein S0880_08565 [Actinomycetota bacterium]|nr:hypothetical protein [Actinomycetota bacterium]
MGQPVSVMELPSSRAGVLRYEINRSLTGMGHERYLRDEPVIGDRPPDELARRLFERGGIKAVHVYGSMITVELDSNETSGVKEVLEGLFTYYRPGVEVPAVEA